MYEVLRAVAGHLGTAGSAGPQGFPSVKTWRHQPNTLLSVCHDMQKMSNTDKPGHRRADTTQNEHCPSPASERVASLAAQSKNKQQAIWKSVKSPKGLNTQEALLSAAISGAFGSCFDLLLCVGSALSHRSLLGFRLI